MKYLFVSIVVLLVSCAASKRIDLSRIRMGMSKYEVVQALGRNPDNLIGAKQYPGGTIEVLQYSRYDPWSGWITEVYWLYFWNDRLRQWGRPGDWEKEANRIYEFRFR